MNLFALFLIACFLAGPLLAQRRNLRNFFLGVVLLLLVVAYYFFNQI